MEAGGGEQHHDYECVAEHLVTSQGVHLLELPSFVLGKEDFNSRKTILKKKPDCKLLSCFQSIQLEFLGGFYEVGGGSREGCWVNFLSPCR